MLRNSPYSPILTPDTRRTFFDYVEAIDIPEIDYFAVGVQQRHTQHSISIMSRPDWQHHYVTHGYAERDPVRQAVLNTPRHYLCISEIDCVDSFGQEIMRQRTLAGICEGLILIQRYPAHNVMVTLGTGFTHFSAAEFLLKHYQSLYQMAAELGCIIANDADAFLHPEGINHLCSDAK